MKDSILIIYSDVGIDNAIRKVVDLQIQGFQELGVEVRVLVTNRAPMANEAFQYPRSFVGEIPGFSQLKSIIELTKGPSKTLIGRALQSFTRRVREMYLYHAVKKQIDGLNKTNFLGLIQHNDSPISHALPKHHIISYHHSFKSLEYQAEYLKYHPEALRKKHSFCVLGKPMQEWLTQKTSVTEQSVHIVDNPISSLKLIEQSRQTYQLNTNNKIPEQYFIHVGRFIKVKRHVFLLEAYKKSEVQTPLLLVGEGELHPTIQSKIIELGLEDRVFLLGYITNPYPLIAQAKGLLLSSSSEGMPMTILEALALNTPVIATDCPSGPREILGEYHPEALSPIEDLHAFAQLIKQLDQKPYTVHHQLIKRFHPKKHGQRLLQLLTENA